jgi:hypothetical protein
MPSASDGKYLSNREVPFGRNIVAIMESAMSEDDVAGVSDYEGAAAGWGALKAVADAVRDQMDIVKETRGLLSMNQPHGFDAVFCIGHNLGTNHPRMLTTLREVSKRGEPIIVFNPRRDRCSGDRPAVGDRGRFNVDGHASRGGLKASEHLRSEPAIIVGIALATSPNTRVGWADLVSGYGKIRDCIEAVFPAFADFNARIKKPGGFRLYVAASEREWLTPTKKANFLIYPGLEEDLLVSDRDALTLTTIRSHDQYNTTIYGMNDRYRGITGRRSLTNTTYCADWLRPPMNKAEYAIKSIVNAPGANKALPSA